MKRLSKQRIAFFAFIIIIATSAMVLVLITNNAKQQNPTLYTYEIIESYNHDEMAFTQGLEFIDGFLFESTGLFGESTLRKVDLKTGKVLEFIDLEDQYFGEGITIMNDKIIQLTWISNIGFIYEKETFELVSEFSYPTEGWGITNNGIHLIMSDGTSNLFFLDPKTFETVKQIEVVDKEPVINLNELEYINGKIYANIWYQDKIAIINPETGIVEGWINMTGINIEDSQDPTKVLNGIAYDSEKDRIFITGKRWSKLFQIKLIKID